MREIPIRGRGFIRCYALVDDEDYEFLAQFKWHMNGTPGYAARRVPTGHRGPRRQDTLFMHHVVAERAGIPRGPIIDHIDRNSFNNQRANLRTADRKLNANNRRIVPRKPTLPETLPRDCELCQISFTPIRKKAAQRFCSLKCQRGAIPRGPLGTFVRRG